LSMGHEFHPGRISCRFTKKLVGSSSGKNDVSCVMEFRLFHRGWANRSRIPLKLLRQQRVQKTVALPPGRCGTAAMKEVSFFSSTRGALYGNPDRVPIAEKRPAFSPEEPPPYGRSKLLPSRWKSSPRHGARRTGRKFHLALPHNLHIAAGADPSERS